MQRLSGVKTTWHITWGTYGTRLHGGERPTVDRAHNQRGEPFMEYDPELEERKRRQMKSPPVHLTREQQAFMQTLIPDLCKHGGWDLRICAADHDHVHVLLDIDTRIHGERARRLLKRWLTQAMNEKWPRPANGTWWAEEGSNRPVKDESYFNSAYRYIEKQRA